MLAPLVDLRTIPKPKSLYCANKNAPKEIERADDIPARTWNSAGGYRGQSRSVCGRLKEIQGRPKGRHVVPLGLGDPIKATQRIPEEPSGSRQRATKIPRWTAFSPLQCSKTLRMLIKNHWK